MTKYNAAIIGLGKIGLTYDLASNKGRPLAHTLAYELSSEITLLAGADEFPQAKESFNCVAPNAIFYTNYQQMLQAHIDAIDIVSICTPQKLHLEQLKYILLNTKAKLIFCEKPLVSNYEEYTALKNLLDKHPCIILPNISRRFNPVLQDIQIQLNTKKIIGDIQKVHVRYTRGIYNTGSHMFDLLAWWIGKILSVQTISPVYTSSADDNEASYTFNFIMENDIIGYAEAFNDKQYYMFEIDIYGSLGKLEFRNSGNDILIYNICPHPLFPNFNSLTLTKTYNDILQISNLASAIQNITEILADIAKPLCTLEDAFYPLCVAKAIEHSFKSQQKSNVL